MLVNHKQLCDVIGLHSNTVTDYRKQGMPVEIEGLRGKPNQYDTVKVFDWLLQKRIAELVGEKTDGEVIEYIDKEREQARLYKGQADSVEIKNKIARAELAPIEILEYAEADRGAQMGSILEALPIQLKRRCPELSASAITMVEKEIARTRNICADVRVREHFANVTG